MIPDFSNSLTWGAPWWFCALALLPVIAGLFIWSERRRIQLVRRLVAARLQPILAGSVSLFKRCLHFALVLGALACFGISMAQPRYGYTVEESKRKGRDVLIAVDTSRSMLADDVKPNRLERAKFAAQDLINALEGDRVGLIAFAGSGFLQAPLTVDYSAVLSSLNELDTKIIPLGGTNIAEAIRTAVEAFGKGEGESRCLIIFTDGEDLDSGALEEARKASSSMRIFTVGVGTAKGSLIPISGEDTQFIKDANGQFVKSRLDEQMLTGIAEATGGSYVRLENGSDAMRQIIRQGLGKLKENEIDARSSHRLIERYQWPLGLGIVLLASSVLIRDRRRKPANGSAVLALLVAMACFAPHAANAGVGEELYKQNRFDEARQKYEEALKRRPGLPELEFDKGTTDYSLGDLEAAATSFTKALAASDPKLRAKVEQNLGTTLLKRALGRDESKESKERETDLKNSVQHLEEALKLEKSNTDAKTNLTIARTELAKPKPTPPPSDKDKKQDNKKDDKDQQSKDQQSKDQQSKDQQSKDQQSKDQQSKDQQSKDQQSKDQQSKDQQSKDQQSKDQQGRPSGTPPPPTDEKKLSGELKANESKPDEKEGEQAEGEIPVKPGEMSLNQARVLLDSLKGEDAQPFKHEQRSAAPVLKDW